MQAPNQIAKLTLKYSVVVVIIIILSNLYICRNYNNGINLRAQFLLLKGPISIL